MTRESDRDPALLPPRVTLGDRWRRRADGVEVEVSDDRPDGFGRVRLREVETDRRLAIGRYELGRYYDPPGTDS